MMELAARALADIAANNPTTSQRIVDMGAVEPMVGMLGGGRGNDAQKSAAGALATITEASFLEDKKSAEGTSPVPATTDLALSAEPSNGSAPAAAPAPDDPNAPTPLDEKTIGHSTIEHSCVSTAGVIATCGGVPPLVELLKSARVGPHENASRAIWQLGRMQENQFAIARAGGIVPLVALLSTGSEATQRHAAAAMESLAKDCPCV